MSTCPSWSSTATDAPETRTSAPTGTSTRHRLGCLHCRRVRLLGRDFQAWRAAWLAALEDAAVGYVPETLEYVADHPSPTFKAYLIANTGAAWPMSGSCPLRSLS